MPSFFEYLFGSEPPEPSRDVDEPRVPCPNEQDDARVYRVLVTVTTRAGDIPLRGLDVAVDGASIGDTGDDGQSPESEARSNPTAEITVRHENDAEHLKAELFTLPVTGIDAESKTFTAGEASNLIEKVQDVFGSGDGGFGGDLDFRDTYAATADVEMEDTDNPDVKRLRVRVRVRVRMATLSLTVPYLSQVGPGETVQTAAPTPANPAGQTNSYAGNAICMPTSARMCVEYWGITEADGDVLSRNDIMQRCWDDHPNPSPEYPCPWQLWGHLRSVVSDLAEEGDPGVYTVTSGPAYSGGDIASIPSDYADAIVAELTAGHPIATSTYATAGHVMVVRGAVVKHDGEAAWLIFNDPYGNLASPGSIYDRLDISAPVGLRGTSQAPEMNLDEDVRAVREVLTRLGHYDGPIDGPIDENDPGDATVQAIRAFQGAGGDGRVDPGAGTERRMNRRLERGARSRYSTAEGEVNAASGAGSERGRHVYYNGGTEARGPGSSGHFRLKAQAWTLVIEPVTPLTMDGLSERLMPGA